MILPHLADWIEEKTAISVATTVEAQPYGDFVCPPLVNTSQAFLDAIDGHCAGVSQDDLDRIHHAHGHTCQVPPFFFSSRFAVVACPRPHRRLS